MTQMNVVVMAFAGALTLLTLAVSVL